MISSPGPWETWSFYVYEYARLYKVMKIFIMNKKPSVFLISLIISAFLSSNFAYSSNASLRVPNAFQDEAQNLPVKFKEAANLIKPESGYNFDIKRDVFWKLFQDIDGLMICPIAETLAAKGVFTEDLFGEPSHSRWVMIKDIAERYKKLKKKKNPILNKIWDISMEHSAAWPCRGG